MTTLNQRAQQLRAMGRQLERAMVTETTRVAGEAQALLTAGINAGVYATTPGAYVRTGKLGAGARVEAVKAGHVVVSNSAPYANYVEFGQSLDESEPASTDELTALAKKKKGQELLYLGRTGELYAIPNPAHLRAAYYALEELKRAHSRVLRAAWNKGGTPR